MLREAGCTIIGKIIASFDFLDVFFQKERRLVIKRVLFVFIFLYCYYFFGVPILVLSNRSRVLGF